MKKSLCIILSLVMILFTFAACGEKEGEDFEFVTDTKGQYVLDDEGNKVTKPIEKDEDGNPITSTTTTTTTTTPDKTNSSGKQPDSSSSSGQDIIDSKPLDEGKKTEDTNLVDTILRPVFESKKFTMELKISADGVYMPMTMTVNGDDAAFLISMENMKGMEEMESISAYIGDDVKLIVKDGKSYSAMEMFGQKIYMETDGADLGMDMDGIINPTGDASLKYVKTTTVKDGNKTYTCEEYKSDNGSVTKYYFEGKKWVRLEILENGSSSITEITSFKNTVENKIFDLSGYTKFDENSFASSLGGM